ncbi:chemotaxis protein CheB [Magnetospira thiophila]
MKAHPSHIVGIGASAGGLEAIQAFFKHMQPETGLAFVVVQHLSPDYKSLMVELLAKVTDIPVQRAENGMEVLADNIYLIPPQKNLKIFHGALLLSEQERSSSTVNLPIDIFLTSLAEDCESKAVAVILSGTGSDGTRGCRAVKEAGGMIMVQEEATAKFNGMPRSVIASGLPDFILPADEMHSQLLAYSKHPYTAREGHERTLLNDNTGISRIFSMLREKSKIDFTYYKPNTVVRRIERRMTVNQVDSLEDYVRFLEHHPSEQTTLYREMLIGVTSFFRDPDVFNLLEENWLPALITKVKNEEFRIWVAGCSTGEEAYSYAILCQEIMDRAGIHRDVKIFATDVDQDAIITASAGVFPVSVTVDIPANMLSKYFIKQGDDYRVTRQIREMVVFARHNLIKDPPFTNIELISCRNLLIYLQPILQIRVLEAFNFSLRSGGILVLGSSESLGDAESFFDTLSGRWKIFKSRGNRKPMMHSERFSTAGLFRSQPTFRDPEGGRAQSIYEEERVLGRFVAGLADGFLPFTILVNEDMELLHVIGDSKAYLNPPSGKVVNDVTKLIASDLSIALSTGLSKVFSAGTEISFTNVRLTANHEERVSVDMRIRPLPEQRGKSRLAAVFIIETGRFPTKPTLAESPESFDIGKEAEQRIIDLEQELQFTRENLQASIEELETSNEELQATNEELLASNEELQSTNEELQSVNEELFTVNAEYQNKITELTELTNDLDNFVNSTAVISIFLDENLDIRRFTANAKQVFNILDHDVGRPFDHISHQLLDFDLVTPVRQVNQKGTPVSLQVRTQKGDWYQLRVRPYMVSQRTQSGVVIVLNEINDLKSAQTSLEDATKRSEMAQVAAHIGTWEWDIGQNSLYWSENIENLFGLDRGTFKGTYDEFTARVHPEDLDEVEKAIADALAGKSDYDVEHRVIWPNGKTVRWMAETGEVLRDDSGQPVKMLGLVRDITDRKLAEDKLLQNKALLTSILAATPTGIGLMRNHAIVWVNRKFEIITGYSKAELLKQSSRILYASDAAFERATDPAQWAMDEHNVGTVRLQWRKKDGAMLEVIAFITAIATDDPTQGMAFAVIEANKVRDMN